MTESLILRTERQEHIAFFDVSGYIDNTGGKQIADTCNDLIAEGIHHFIFDLNRCAAVSIFIELIEKIKKTGAN